ncbi:hypothetical protein KAR91_35045 [Candidatus Pacearchaeota archaeon]|nr:hypothetical protein [Candidatus Pacearchaeota archaeon]
MGTPIEPPEPGIACPLCWGGSDSPFGLGFPPGNIQVEFSGIQKGLAWTPDLGEPPNGVVSILPDVSCQWIEFGSIDFFLLYSSGLSRLFAVHQLIIPSFRAEPTVSCVQDFVSDLLDPAFRFYGGTAHVYV